MLPCINLPPLLTTPERDAGQDDLLAVTLQMVMAWTSDEQTARKIYQKTLDESRGTERGKKIVQYLAPYMGDKSDGDQK